VPFYKKLSAATYQSESDVVEQFELALRLLANPRDRLHLEILAKEWGAPGLAEDAPSFQSVDDPVASLRALASAATKGCASMVLGAVDALKWSGDDFKFLNAVTVLEDYANTLAENDRALVLQDSAEWKKQWNYYVRSEPGGSHSIPSFLGQVALGTTQQPTEDGLALLTVHSAKGMEFDVVFLMGMNDGTFPDYRAHGPALEEERRNAFVAVTRSKRLLYVTYPKTKVMPWGAVRAQQPSPYVSELFG
jgi:DNA helicase-2/ATP-dependent DNA helicase PcrA